MLLALICAIGTAVAATVAYFAGRHDRKSRLMDAWDAGYDAGWDECVAAWHEWEARQAQAGYQMTYEPEPQIERVRETVMLEPITVVLPVIRETEPVPAMAGAYLAGEPAYVAGEPTEAEVAASRALHGYIPELEDYVSGPQPAIALPEGDEWEDDSLGLLREAGDFPEPPAVVHDEEAQRPPVALPEPPRVPFREPGPETTVWDIAQWGQEMRSTLNWRDEDWATTMPWERAGDDRMLVAA